MKKIYMIALAICFMAGSTLKAQNYLNKIVFSLPSTVDGIDSVCTINPDGSGFTFITQGARPRVAHDKNTLAYIQGNQIDNYLNDLYFKVGNNTPSVFFDNTSHQSMTNFDFTPHDHFIVYDWDHGLYFTESNNPNGQGFAGSCSGDLTDNYPRISPIDSQVVIHNPNHGLYLMPVLQNGCDHIANTVAGDFSPCWSPDGQWIYFMKQYGNINGAMHNIYKIKPDGSNLTQITHFSNADTLGMSLVITENGKWAVAPARFNGVVGIYKFNLINPNSFGYLVRPFNYLQSPVNTIWVGSVDSVSDDLSMSVIETEQMMVEAYPNPTNNIVQINLEKNISGTVRLYNINGIIVSEQKVQNTNSFTCNLSGLATGVYMLQGYANGKQFTKRIIKQ